MLFHQVSTKGNNVEQYRLSSLIAYKNEIKPYRVVPLTTRNVTTHFSLSLKLRHARDGDR